MEGLGEMIYILVEAGEGDTQAICFGSTEKNLIENLVELFDPNSYTSSEGKEFKVSECAALLQMLAAHKDWKPGRYILSPSVPPIWEEWTLFIAERFITDKVGVK